MATPSPRDFLTKGQLSALGAAERTMSVISLLATMFIFGTFVAFDFFRKPRNRLVFWASLGNAMTNIATLISTSGFIAGPSSALCQFQGFLIQMFMPADTLWTLCMALNVYFTFFRNYNAADLRKLEKWYLLLCYGSTLVPALIYLILDHTAKTGIYGPALIWCWVSVKWEWMRLAFFYGPVWICILTTMSIHIWTGRNVLKQRAALRAFFDDRGAHLPPPDNPVDPLDLANVTRVTEITITTEALRSASRTNSLGSFSIPRKLSSPDIVATPRSDEGTQVLQASLVPLQRSSTKQVATSSPMATCTATVTTGSSRAADSMDTAGDHGASHLPPKCYRKTVNNANRATIGYAKVAVPMFVAMLIVWVPSTINRVYSLVHYPGVHTSHPNFTLNLIAALVLPTQGFWNAIIYTITSWSQCRAAWRQIRYGERPSNVHYLKRRRSNTSDVTPASSTQPLRSGSFSLDRSSCNRPAKPRETREMSLLEAMAMGPGDEMDFDVDVERAIPACARPKGRGLAMGQRYTPHKAVVSPSILSEENRTSEETEVDEDKHHEKAEP